MLLEGKLLCKNQFTYTLFPSPSLPSSPTPHAYTSPVVDKAKQWRPPELTATLAKIITNF